MEVAVRSETNVVEHSPAQKARTRRRLLVSRFFGLAAVVAMLFVGSAWSLPSPLLAESLFAIGLVLVIVGALGRLWCQAYISGRKMQVLVAVGPYSLCRHPLYFFSSVGAVGLGLCTHTLSGGLLMATAFAVYYPWAIRGEEAFLSSIFPGYAQYSDSVPAFFPRLSGYAEAERIDLCPRRLRREILATAGAFAFVCFAEVVDGLHRAGMLPTLFLVP